MFYVIAYDITNATRLRRVARRLERAATRCQKSVFLFRGSHSTLQVLLNEIVRLMDLDSDVIQAWAISVREPMMGTVRGVTPNAYSAGVLLAPTQLSFILRRR